MKPLSLIMIAAAVLPLAAAAAAEPVAVPAFRSIELKGGGTVTVRPGPRQQVNLIEGDRRVSDIRVEDGRLVIRACRESCRNYRLRVEIVTPRIEGAAIEGGGAIDLQPGFAAQDNLALAIRGGGNIDADRLPARTVAASIRGGGTIEADARSSLVASVNGGGAILYRGDPEVTSAVRGGGSVARIGAD